MDYDSDDEGVEPCRFKCDIGNKYAVAYELNKDTAQCYKCGWKTPAKDEIILVFWKCSEQKSPSTKVIVIFALASSILCLSGSVN